MSHRLHDDEIDVDEQLVRRLLTTLDPAALPAYDVGTLRRLGASGSTNALFRLGDDLVVRLPRQPGGGEAIAKERRWVPYVAAHLPVPVPELVAVGEPAHGYPERWAVVRYLDGETPGLPAPGEAPRHTLATELAEVVGALRELGVPREARDDPALRWYRGLPLATMDDDVRGFLEQCRRLVGEPGFDLDLPAVGEAWERTMRLPEAHRGVEPRWYHGDLAVENLLVSSGRLCAVLDFGTLSVGDPTIDLVPAWQLLDREARSTYRDLLGVDDATWRLGRGWALALGVMAPPYYWETMRQRCLAGLHLAREALLDAESAYDE